MRGPRLYRGWYVVAAAFGAAFASVSFLNPILGAFVTPLEDEFGWDRAQIAVALTIGGLAAAPIAPVVGWLMDRYGGRVVVPVAGIVLALVLFGMSGLQSYWQLLVLYPIGRGVSLIAVNQAPFMTAANWFIRRRAFAVSVVGLGLRAGLATLPLLIALVIDTTGSWRLAWVMLAGIVLALTVAPPAMLLHRRPEDLGLLPDGDPTPPEGTPPPGPDPRDFTLREAIRSRSYWLLNGSVTLMGFCAGSINFLLIPYLEDRGLEPTRAALVVTVMALVGIAGGLGGGGLATLITSRRTMALGMAMMAVGLVILISVTTFPLAVGFAALYGFAFSAIVTMERAIFADYFGRASLGVIRGSSQPIQMVISSFGPSAAAWWSVRADSYTAPFAVFVVMLLAAAVLLALAPYPTRPVGEARSS